MRVISGEKRGLRLTAPKGTMTRPTEDRIKESIFNALGIVKHEPVCDLFAGSGQIGIEFLSRGASHCHFVDESFNAINVVKENIQKAKYEDKSTVLKMKAMSFLKTCEPGSFGYIYLDPPYRFSIDEYRKILETIRDFAIIKETGIVILEHTFEDREIFEGYTVIKTKNYGEKTIDFLEVL